MKRATIILLCYLSVAMTMATAQPQAFLDLSPATAADATPTPHQADQPVSSLEVAPGSLVRVTAGFRFQPFSDVTRWYVLSLLLDIDHPYVEVVTVNPSDISENAFWHPHVTELGLRAQVRAAVSPVTAPLRANLLHPDDASSAVFSSSSALWVVLAPAGNTVTQSWYVGHTYLRVKQEAPPDTAIPIGLTHVSDANRTSPNSLLATDGTQHYHLFGEHLLAQGALITVRAPQTQVVAQVHLGDFLGDPLGQQMDVQIRQPGNAEPIETYIASLDDDSTIRITTALRGTYDLSVKGGHWLRQTMPNVNLSGTVHVDFFLQNGDVDGDNEVSLFDFGMLVAAFGSAPGNGNWNPYADLDGDEEVSLFDFGVLVRNFGAIGDE